MFPDIIPKTPLLLPGSMSPAHLMASGSAPKQAAKKVQK